MNWKGTMAASGLTEEKLSHSVRKKVKEFNEYSESLAEKRKLFKASGTSAADKDKLDSEIETLNAAVLALDKQLVKDMVRLAKNQQHYADIAKRLPSKKKTTDAAVPAAATATATPAASNGQQTKLAATGQTAATPATSTIKTPASPQPPKQHAAVKKTEGDKKKKGGNGVLIALGVIGTGILAYFGYTKIIKPMIGK